MPKEEAQKIALIFKKIVAKKTPIKDLENWNITKSGKKVLFLTNGVPILDEKGNLLGYRGVDKDITELKQAEEKLINAKLNLEQRVKERTAELKKSETKFSSLFKSSRDAIMTLEPPTWKFTSGNPATIS